MKIFKLLPKEVTKPVPHGPYTAQQLMSGDCPEGVYVTPKDCHESENRDNKGWFIVIKKTAGDAIGTCRVADTCNVLLCYYPALNRLHPGTPREDTTWEHLPDANVAFNINQIGN